MMEKTKNKSINFKMMEDDINNTNRVVEKPITLVVEDFQNALVNVINESHLPFFIVENVVEKLLANVKNASIQQLEADKISYQNQLKEVENQGENKTE